MGFGDEPNRERRHDEEALEEIRRLFARYRQIDRHGMVTERDEPAELRPEQPNQTPALRGP